MQGTWESTRMGGRQRAWGEDTDRTFLVVSAERNGGGSVSGFRGDYFGLFQWALGQRLSLAVWYLALGLLGQGFLAQNERTLKKEGIEVWALDWMVCKWKVGSQFFVLSRNQLTLGGAASLSVSKASDIKRYITGTGQYGYCTEASGRSP